MRQIQWWDEHRIVSPEMVGHARTYTLEQAQQVAIVRDMRSRGMSLQAIRKCLKKTGGDFLVVTAGKQAIQSNCREGALSIATASFGPVLIVQTAAIRAAVAKAAACLTERPVAKLVRRKPVRTQRLPAWYTAGQSLAGAGGVCR